MNKTQLIDETIVAISDKFDADDLKYIRNVLVSVVQKYHVQKESTEIVKYEGFIPDVFKVYLVSQKINGLSDKTLKHYSLVMKDFFYYVNKEMPDITNLDIREYLAVTQKTRGISANTLNNRRSIICSFFSWCVNEDYLPKNPCANIKAIKFSTKQRIPLTGMQMEQLRNACEDERDRAMVEFFYSTGCRVSEVVGANISDIDWSKGELTVLGKGNKYRPVYLSPSAIYHLKLYLKTRTDENDALFVSNREPHNRLSKNRIECQIKHLGELVGIKLYPHLIRHTTATDCLQKGMPVENVQKFLGHSNINTTMIYAKTDASMVKLDHKRCIG